MSILATVFVAAITIQKLQHQADFLGDTVKIASIAAVGTASAGFVCWTILHMNVSLLTNRPILRGALAGVLTALLIIPLPVFAWTLKTEVLGAYGSGDAAFLGALWQALSPAIKNGLETFAYISKASVVAITASLIVGGYIAGINDKT